MQTVAHFRFENVTRRFGGFTAVDGITLDIARGETFSLLGPSGCGKTTLLRLAAGFDNPDGGRILLEGRDITALPPDKRPVNTVFQNYALFPHLTVRENIAFGPKTARKPAAEIRRAVDEMLALVDLHSHSDKKPAQLSGGMKQRVAIARALVNKPAVLLLDEPLAALDLKLRQRLLAELGAIHRETGTTFLYVTHDQSEAMSISDRIAVMNHGVIEQIGPPAEIYESPRTSFVATFIGDADFLRGEIVGEIDTRHSRCLVSGLGEIVIRHDRQVRLGERVSVSLRPEKLVVFADRPTQRDGENVVAGTVDDVTYFGSHSRCHVRCGGIRLRADIRRGHEAPPVRGAAVWLSWRAADGFLLEKFHDEPPAE
jgi:spermidine/putrescine transport system ATP-binding protein